MKASTKSSSKRVKSPRGPTPGTDFKLCCINKDGYSETVEVWLSYDGFGEFIKMEVMCEPNGTNDDGSTIWVEKLPKIYFDHASLDDTKYQCAWMRIDQIRSKNVYKKMKFANLKKYTFLTGCKELNPDMLKALNGDIVFGRNGYYPWIILTMDVSINGKDVAVFRVPNCAMNFTHGDSVHTFIKYMNELRKKDAMMLNPWPIPPV